MSVTRSSFTVSTLQEVTREVSTKAIVGFENTDDSPDGWQFDIKRWATTFDQKLPVLPRLSNPSYQGLNVESSFKSGVSDSKLPDFNILEVKRTDLDTKTSWLPILNVGTYFRYNEEYDYFSDDSVVEYVDPNDNESNRNVLLLSEQPNIDTPISAVIFKRDPTTKFPKKYIESEWVGEFSGIYISGEEQETVDDLGTINWSNVDTTKKQFMLDNSFKDKYYLRFNRDLTFSIGREITNFDDVGVCEQIGISSGSEYQLHYTKYFPIIPASVHLYVTNETGGTYAEWTQVDSLWELENTVGSNRYFVDKDFGGIYFGTGGDIPAEGEYLMLTYDVTIRVEYEPVTSDKRIEAIQADLNPVNQSQNQGFVCITHNKPEAANIELTLDKSAISGTSPVEYGPIYAGSDYSLLRATVTSIDGVVVPKTEVTFTLTPVVGSFSGVDTLEVLTNGSGQAFSSYQPPTNASSLGFYSRTVRASTTTTNFNTTNKEST